MRLKTSYHFIIKELAKEFERQISCLGENTEKYITLTGPIEKNVTGIDKKRRRNYKKYIIHIIVHR